MEESLLKTLVAWVLSSGGAGVIGYWIVEKWLGALTPENKRYAAFALTGAVAVAVWFVGIAMQYQPVPVDARVWIEAIVSVIGTAIGVGQLIHAKRNLSVYAV